MSSIDCLNMGHRMFWGKYSPTKLGQLVNAGPTGLKKNKKRSSTINSGFIKNDLTQLNLRVSITMLPKPMALFTLRTTVNPQAPPNKTPIFSPEIRICDMSQEACISCFATSGQILSHFFFPEGHTELDLILTGFRAFNKTVSNHDVYCS